MVMFILRNLNCGKHNSIPKVYLLNRQSKKLKTVGDTPGFSNYGLLDLVQRYTVKMKPKVYCYLADCHACAITVYVHTYPSFPVPGKESTIALVQDMASTLLFRSSRAETKFCKDSSTLYMEIK